MNNNDSERIVKLVNEYTVRLKELINFFQLEKKNRFNIILSISISILIIYGLLFFYFQFGKSEISNEKYLLSIAVVIAAILILLLYTLINFQKGKRNSNDIKDEAYLIRKQLKQLVQIASQTREHLKHFDNLVLLEIDLKLTEAEDMIDRANRTFYFPKENNTNANN
uniref:hypothetical protein n=1 Tax=Gelidibacter sp. TaxID=2018083 RepID=UPI0040499532